MELVTDDLREAPFKGFNEKGAASALLYKDAVPLLQAEEKLSIRCEDKVSTLSAPDIEADYASGCDKRPVGKGKRADRGDDHRGHIRIKYRAAGGEGVSRAARGCGYYHAIALEDAKGGVVEREVQRYDLRDAG